MVHFINRVYEYKFIIYIRDEILFKVIQTILHCLLCSGVIALINITPLLWPRAYENLVDRWHFNSQSRFQDLYVLKLWCFLIIYSIDFIFFGLEWCHHLLIFNPENNNDLRCTYILLNLCLSLLTTYL